jgi:two-component system sensor histidine kinase BaeS
MHAPSRSPLEEAFLEQQYRVFYCLGGGVFLLTLVLTVSLSRRLLRPVRKLADGTQALASRRFDTRIRVRSRNELGRLAEDFNRMAETLETYEALRKEWISDISHELRTPLSILQGEIQALQDGVRPLIPEALDSLRAEVERLGGLVEALHFLSLSDSEGLAMRRDRVAPLPVLNDRIEAFQEPMKRSGIEIRLDTEGAKHAFVVGDADQLGRMFSNLLQNTLQYTNAPGNLIVRAGKRDGSLEIVFQDSPPGVPDEALGRLFDRLFRVDRSRSRALGGSGLGLSIAKRIVEAHGGEMRAAHAVTGGLEMTVTLPLAGRDG